MNNQPTPYDEAIEAMNKLHGDLLETYFTMIDGMPERVIVSGQCTQAKVILGILVMMKGQYENNLRSAT